MDEDLRLKSMYKAPPKKQIGGSNISSVKSSTTGVRGYNLLQKKGVVVGGGGIIGSKAPAHPYQSQAELIQDQNIETAYLPGYRVGIDSPMKQTPIGLKNNTMLDTNLNIYTKSSPSAGQHAQT